MQPQANLILFLLVAVVLLFTTLIIMVSYVCGYRAAMRNLRDRRIERTTLLDDEHRQQNSMTVGIKVSKSSAHGGKWEVSFEKSGEAEGRHGERSELTHRNPDAP